jgi:hypothetical protein
LRYSVPNERVVVRTFTRNFLVSRPSSYRRACRASALEARDPETKIAPYAPFQAARNLARPDLDLGQPNLQ